MALVGLGDALVEHSSGLFRPRSKMRVDCCSLHGRLEPIEHYRSESTARTISYVDLPDRLQAKDVGNATDPFLELIDPKRTGATLVVRAHTGFVQRTSISMHHVSST
jgi:hypothetical protein